MVWMGVTFGRDSESAFRVKVRTGRSEAAPLTDVSP